LKIAKDAKKQIRQVYFTPQGGGRKTKLKNIQKNKELHALNTQLHGGAKEQHHKRKGLGEGK